MAARSALGPDLDLRLDANGAWSEDIAFHMLKNFAPYEIAYIEQPIPAGDLAALKRLRDSTRVPIAADEEVTDVESARRVIESGAADVLVIKPLQLGGIGPCRHVAQYANACGLDVTITTSIDSGIGTAAALHLAAALAGSTAAGLATLPLLECPLTVEAPVVEAGRMRLPPGPGLGVRLDASSLRKYAEIVVEL
jgi:L-alanine-DL-glutamate epimerase-like enolase superfamily enzyme